MPTPSFIENKAANMMFDYSSSYKPYIGSKTEAEENRTSLFKRSINSIYDILSRPSCEFIDIKTQDGLSKSVLILNSEKNLPTDKDKFIIYNIGNNTIYQTEEIIRAAEELSRNTGSKVVLSNYRSVESPKTTSLQNIVEDNIEIYKYLKLKNNLISDSNITFYGHSFGGAIATLSAYKCYNKNPKKCDVKLINDRSFTSSSNFLTTAVIGTKAKLLNSIIEKAMDKVSIHIDAEKAISQIPKKENILLVSVKQDENINTKSAMISSKKIQGIKTIESECKINEGCDSRHEARISQLESSKEIFDAIKAIQENQEKNKIHINSKNEEGKWTKSVQQKSTGPHPNVR